MGLNMDCISSPYPYPFEQNQDAVRPVADTHCVWLGNYVNWNHKASHRRQQQISLVEIASGMDRRWSKKFMPREFV
jgi:hypothetical protein